MSRATEMCLAVCAVLVSAVALCWLLGPEDFQNRVIVELRPADPVESTGDRAATEGV